MRKLLLGVALAVAGCREDAGLAPEAEDQAMRGTAAQCLAPSRGEADPGSAVIGSRIASVFSRGSAMDVVCLSMEEGRWRLRPSP